MRHFSIFATSLTLDLEGVEFNPGNLVYLYYFVADSDIHIECGSTDIFSADNPKSWRQIFHSSLGVGILDHVASVTGTVPARMLQNASCEN